jgi:hypothetical protein
MEKTGAIYDFFVLSICPAFAHRAANAAGVLAAAVRHTAA